MDHTVMRNDTPQSSTAIIPWVPADEVVTEIICVTGTLPSAPDALADTIAAPVVIVRPVAVDRAALIGLCAFAFGLVEFGLAAGMILAGAL